MGGGIRKRDVPTIHECTVNKHSRVRTDTYELTNNTWNGIQWDVDNGYINEEGLNMDRKLQTYIYIYIYVYNIHVYFKVWLGQVNQNYSKNYKELDQIMKYLNYL